MVGHYFLAKKHIILTEVKTEAAATKNVIHICPCMSTKWAAVHID
jgi:hypothetical protein